jgi:origin recognition complex subunit 6
MDYIVAPFGTRTQDAWINQNITALLGAVYFYVTIRVVALTKDQPITKEPFALQRREILRLLEQARVGVQVNAADPWVDWQEVKSRDFNSAVTQLEEQGWLLADWFKGLDDIIRPKDWDMTHGYQAAGDEDMDPTVPTQTTRSETMFQDKHDYLSEARRADYVAWKADILQRISHLTEAAAATSTPMEIDTR